ncbi:MAG TPA: proprotein convertase P-domain-containing protein, partial [Flavobacteriales bacterium]|nr:proprotein convertase P-domain-containing protein [Flavobacteriales bacterium]
PILAVQNYPVRSIVPDGSVIQMMNGGSGAYFQIFNKAGTSLGARVYYDNFFSTAGGLGDPVVLYDQLADRWLMSEFGASGNHLYVAISTTPDPTGTWYSYDFTTPSFPDYPKYSVWNGMYMITTNESSCALYALDRTKMLVGDGTATSQRFTTADYATISFQATTPVTFDGTTPPPAGAPAMLMRMADDGWSGVSTDRLEIWTLTVDFTTPANSVLSNPTYLNVSDFDTELCGFTSFSCIDQPGSNTNLDPLREVIMNRAQYRNFGTHESIVCNHVTDVNGNDRAGIRWYELRRVGGPTQPWTVYQEGTYAPGTDSRWMAAISMNSLGDIGLAYSVSSSTTYPSLRYTGRNASDPLGQMTLAETSIIAGTSPNSSNRWGDYFSLDTDPANGSFWGTGCYNTSTAWGTRIYRFSIPTSLCTPATATATPSCVSTTQFEVNVNLTALGDANSVNIQIDSDGAGGNAPVTVATTSSSGTFGPYGPYASGSPVIVYVRHDQYSECDITLSNVVGECNSPGAGCQFNSTATTAIVDNTTVTNTIVVPSHGGATIADLNVYVNLSHTYTGDLRLTLASPTGTTVGLIANAKCGNNDNMTVEFDDTGANGAVGVTCPMTALFVIPENALSAFNGEVIQGNWTLSIQDVATQDQGTLNSWCLIPTLNSASGVQLAINMFLEGPYDSGSGFMNDDIRAAGLLPLVQPYSGYPFIGGGGETIAPAVRNVTGPDAIVDWVVIELRSAGNSSTVVASRAALVQRDGDVVDLNGTSDITMNVATGSYFVAVRHRNHLGVMATPAIALSSSAATIDFTNSATGVYGTEARKSVGGKVVLWAGDVTFNGVLQYTNTGNDRDRILLEIGGAVPTNTVAGYAPEDVNMNGEVRYTGTNNDRDIILQNIGGIVPTNTRIEQLP